MMLAESKISEYHIYIQPRIHIVRLTTFVSQWQWWWQGSFCKGSERSNVFQGRYKENLVTRKQENTFIPFADKKAFCNVRPLFTITNACTTETVCVNNVNCIIHWMLLCFALICVWVSVGRGTKSNEQYFSCKTWVKMRKRTRLT